MTLYRGNKIAVFDPKTESSRISAVDPHQPYRAQIDKNGEIWTGMHTDRAVQLDPAARRPSTCCQADQHAHRVHRQLDGPVTFWTGGNHGSALVKVGAG